MVAMSDSIGGMTAFTSVEMVLQTLAAFANACLRHARGRAVLLRTTASDLDVVYCSQGTSQTALLLAM